MSSYKYKMLEIEIQKYSNNLNNNPESNRKKSLSASYTQWAGFGSTILELNHVLKLNKISHIQNVYEETNETHKVGIFHNTVKIKMNNYSYKETEYQYGYIPFTESLYAYLICNQYLCKKHQQLTNTDEENKRKACVSDGVLELIHALKYIWWAKIRFSV